MDKNTSRKDDDIKMPRTRNIDFDDTNELETNFSRTQKYRNVMDDDRKNYDDYDDNYSKHSNNKYDEEYYDDEYNADFSQNSNKNLDSYSKNAYNSEIIKKGLSANDDEFTDSEDLDEELEEITTQFKLPDFNSHTKSIQFNDDDIKAVKKVLEEEKDMKKLEKKKINDDKNITETPKKKKKLKLNKRTLSSIILLVVAIPVLAFSGYQVFNYFTYESPQTKKMINNVQENTDIDDDHVPDPENTEIIESDEHPDTPYWNYIKMNLIDVDFTDLKKTNDQTVAWITVGGTNVNYPVVQTTDNDYYLTHSFDKSKNSAGWVFMDYRNTGADYGENTIIYGHNRKDKTMFGTLKNVLSRDWYNNLDNRVIKMSTESYNTLWQIYSVYTLETTNDYIKTNFANEQEYQDFIDLVKGRSTANFNTTVTTKDKTLTLSTCHGSTKKLVIHAKLIKKEAR